MGLLSELSGGASARRARQAAAESNRLLDLARSQAGSSLDQSRTAQLAALGSGYDAAYGTLTDTEARAGQRLNAGADAARGDINTNYDRAAGSVEDYYARTEGLMNPYIQRGNQLGDMYATALGANGAGAASDFYDDYASNDPFRQYRDELANRELQTQFNARGQSGSGRFTSAVSRASLERGSQDLNGYLDRLSNASQQGQQAAGQLGNAAMQTGSQLANIRTGQGNTLAGIEQNRGSGLATLVQNIGTTRAGYQTQQGAANAGVDQNYGNARSNLALGIAQQQGNNLIGSAAAQSQARAGGINNLLGLGGLALSAVTPGRMGTSPLMSLMAGR